MVKMSHESFKKVPPEWVRDRKGGGVEGNLNGNYLRFVSRRQNKLIGKFKMAAGDVISIRGQVLEYTYIPTGIERELVRFGKDGDKKG
jgi:hypothetical protein